LAGTTGKQEDATAPRRAGRPRTERFAVLGVAVDRLTIAEAAERMMDLAQGTALHQVVTVNPEFVITARRHPAFRAVLRRATIATADGMGIVWAAHILGDRLPERVGGVELMEHVAALAARRGRSLYLLGAAEGVAEQAARRLMAEHRGLRVAGAYAGSPHPEDAAALIERIRAAHADILFVAFGAPAQDLWIAEHQPAIGMPVAMGVGGAFDYLAGRAARAPRVVQRAGFEWLYRLAREPWRWRRMLALPRFGAMVLTIRLLAPPRRARS
jgi:N-acetylglucosaminyldiphosphoundecaprenol N-acetyl-beta-D-mannosaminyltransferase